MSENEMSVPKKVMENGKAAVSALDILTGNSQSGILFESVERKVVFANHTFCALFGTPPPEGLIGADCRAIAQEFKNFFVEPEHFVRRVEESIAGHTPVHKEELRLTDGRIFERDYLPVYVDDVYVGHLWQFHDRTEQKRIEEKLTKTVAQLAEAQQLARIGSWDTDILSGASVWSDEFYHIFGLQPQLHEATFQHFINLVHPDDREGILGKIEQAFDKREPYTHECRIVRPDGIELFLQLRGNFEVNDAGTPVRRYGTVQDITERKQTEEDLTKTIKQLAEAQRLAHMGSWEWKPTTNEVSLSDEMYRLYGLDPKEHVPTFQAYLERVHLEDRAFAQEIIAVALRDQQPWEYDARIIRADGTVRVLRTQGSCVVDAAGQVIRTHGTALDVTERKQAEEERAALLQREQDARAKVEAVAQRISQLQEVTATLAEVITATEVATVVAKQGMAALGASTGSIVLLAESGTELEVLCAMGYSEEIVQRWNRFPLAADTPISEAVRTGQPIWLESTEIAVNRYPHLATEFAKSSGHCWASIPLLIGTRAIGALGFRFSESEGINETNQEFMLALAHQCAQALHRARLFKEVREGQEQLQMLSRQLMAAQENERRQIARELHDEIGQALTALKINIRSLLHSPNAGTLLPSLHEDLDIIDGVLQRVRDLSLDLRPPMLDDLGLAAALHWSLFRHAERVGFAATFFSDPQLGRLPAHIETTCYRVAQEALTNIARHTSAQNVRVQLLYHEVRGEGAAQVELAVQDDGAGFDAAAALQRSRHGGSFGLLGMQERVQLARGHIEIHSAPAQGTTIRVRFPIESRDESDTD